MKKILVPILLAAGLSGCAVVEIPLEVAGAAVKVTARTVETVVDVVTWPLRD